MIDSWVDKLKVKNIEKVTLIFFYFDLFDKWLQKNVNWYALVLANYMIEISEHELSHLKLFVVLDEQKS